MPLRATVLLFLLLLAPGTFAQGQTEGETGTEVRQTVPESEIVRCEQELALQLVELNKAQEAEVRQRQAVQSLSKKLEAAKQSGDETDLAAAEAAEKLAVEQLKRLSEQTASAQKLYSQCKEKFEIARKKQELAANRESTGNTEKAKIPFEDVLKRRAQANHASKEAELAQEQTRTLNEQLQTLLERQKELRRISDDLSRKLNSQYEVPSAERQRIWEERQGYTETLRKLTDQIQQVREEILLAEATQRIKEEEAEKAQTAYEGWRSNLYFSGILLTVALLLVLIGRFVLARVVHEPERRYTINKGLSLATTILVVVGLMFIFVDEFSSLLTLIGFAVAGLAIALQEIVASFAAWFFIRGVRGYSTRDWVKLGNDFGEVVDISFLRTSIQQFDPLNGENKPSGANPTGGLIVLMNNAIFKNTLINYSRGYPFVWCSLAYNFTFESNSERAREILLEAMRAEPEIVDTARRARRNIEEMASNFYIRVPSTEPVVRTWVCGIGVELTLRFLAHPRSRPELLDRVNLRVLRGVQQADDVNFAYWTVRSIASPPPEPNEPVLQSENAQPQSDSPTSQPAGEQVRKAG